MMSVSFADEVSDRSPQMSKKSSRRGTASFQDPNSSSPSSSITTNSNANSRHGGAGGSGGDFSGGVSDANKAFEAYRNFHQRGGEDRLSKVMANREGVALKGSTSSDPAAAAGGRLAGSSSFSSVRGHSVQNHLRRGEARGHLATDMYPQKRDGHDEQMLMQRRGVAEALESPVFTTERVKRDGNVGNSGRRTQEDLLYNRSKRDAVAPTMFDIDPADPASYTYGGEASYAMAFSHSNDTDTTEDERQMRYREKHEQTFAALGNMKPFLKTLFGDEENGEGEVEWGQPRRNIPTEEVNAVSLGPLGNGGVSLGGQLANAATPAGQSRAMYNSQSSKRHATRETPTTASSVLPSFNYHDMIARESMKPLILQTTTTTDRCPLTTKTCAPTFTVFNTAPYVASTGDVDAGLYFTETASRAMESRNQNTRNIALGAMYGSIGGAHGNQVHIPTSSYTPNMPYMFSSESASQGSVANGRITTDKMSSGMRVFRDMMLPTTNIATEGVDGHRSYYDEKELVKQAQLRMLLQTIQDAKPVSERSHLPPRAW